LGYFFTRAYTRFFLLLQASGARYNLKTKESILEKETVFYFQLCHAINRSERNYFAASRNLFWDAEGRDLFSCGTRQG
jgi:hypothetical protein